MTARDLDEAILHGLLLDADLIATAPAHLLAPYVEALEQARDNLTRAYEKARGREYRYAWDERTWEEVLQDAQDAADEDGHWSRM